MSGSCGSAGRRPLSNSPVTVFVCTACGQAAQPDSPEGSDGQRLFSALSAAAARFPGITIADVDCLAVCETPVVIAFSSPGKWSYVIGGADPARDAGDILAAATAVAASPHGVPAIKDRPPFFKKGVVSRIPPLPSRA